MSYNLEFVAQIQSIKKGLVVKMKGKSAFTKVNREKAKIAIINIFSKYF